MLGVEATSLMQALRKGRNLEIELGFSPGLPVTIILPCPDAPGYALEAIRQALGNDAVQLRRPGARPTTRDVMLGYQEAGVDIFQTAAHLPTGWLSAGLINASADKLWALQLLRHAFRTLVGAVNMIPVGRLKKGGGDPAYLDLLFASVDDAATFCAAVDQNALPAQLLSALQRFIALDKGSLVTFSSNIPPEAVQHCTEREIVELFQAGMREDACINPQPHAPT